MASSSQHRAQPPSTTTLYASSPYSPPSPPPGPPATSSGADDSLYAAYPYRSSFLDDDPPPARTLYASYPFPPGTKKPTPTRTARSPFHHHHQQQQQPDFANMTEVAFAKQFLAALDARPVKLSADHVEDPRSYPARSAYILPRPPKPMSKPAAGGSSSAGPAPPGSEPSYTVTVKSLRNPPLDLRLTSQTANTAVLDVKDAVVARTHIPADKIKMLFAKKPVLDSKVLKDLAAPGGATTLDFTVMILGGAVTAAEATAKAAAAAGQGEAPKDAAGTFQADVVAQGPSGPEVLQSTEFWDDLKGYLLQRIRDEKEANDVFDTFQTAWKNKT